MTPRSRDIPPEIDGANPLPVYGGTAPTAECPCGATGPCANPRCHVRTGCLPGQIEDAHQHWPLEDAKRGTETQEAGVALRAPCEGVTFPWTREQDAARWTLETSRQVVGKKIDPPANPDQTTLQEAA
jgi:hypothetical protein